MKKLKRLLSVAAALALTLSLVVAPASAVSFSDLTGHWSRQDVEDLANRGIINGYSDGTFKPNAKMSAAEALLFCARAMGIDATVKAQVAQARYSELTALLPEVMRSWAIPEMALCLEAGIISHGELSAMCASGAISQAISRENLSLYLVRAMQLAPMAQSLNAYSLTFSDAASVSQSLRPYVYLLYTYGVVAGNDMNQFMPASTVSRAEMATMLKRALDFMRDKGVSVELPAYTANDWVGGTIAAASTGSGDVTTLTLTSEFSGARALSLPAGVPIYENNMLASRSALKVGQYARVNLNHLGVATSVRVSGALRTYAGSILSLSGGELTLTVEGTSKLFKLDRFTQVQVGNTAGDLSLVDEAAGYTAAVCRVDEMGHLAAVQLSGGVRQEQGIIKQVELGAGGAAIVYVAGFHGVTQRYSVPSGAGVYVNGLLGSLSSTHVGDYVILRVSNDNANEVLSVNVDTITPYVQGSLKSVRTSTTPNSIVVNDFATNRSETYSIASGCVITYNGEQVALSRLESGWFVTLRLSGSSVTTLEAYPGSTTTEGIITAIKYGATTALDVKLADDTIATYSVDLTSPPDIYRGDIRSTIDKLRTGDQVVLTVRYNEVSRIEATPQSANMSGTITRITMEATGVTLELSMDDGSAVSYLVTEGVSVIRDGQTLSLYDLKPGYKVALVVHSDQVVSIEVDKASGSKTQLIGTVLYVNAGDRTILLQWNDGGSTTRVANVRVSGATIMEANGAVVTLSRLETGDAVQVFGSYVGTDFVASLIILT